MVPPFTIAELNSIVDFSQRAFTGNTFLSNATLPEKEVLTAVNRKLRIWSEHIAHLYGNSHGPFEVGFPTGNPIQYNSTRIKTLWSGVFKGNANKQYAAQISIVVNPNSPCLDVGFYFGAAASHDLGKVERQAQESILQQLALSLAATVGRQPELQGLYHELFQFEFLPHANGQVVSEGEWLQAISNRPAGCSIKASVRPDQSGEVTYRSVDSYLSQLMFLMLGVSAGHTASVSIPPLTPQQWARQAERRAMIGFAGEKHIMRVETDKLAGHKALSQKYPRHVALESSHYGYDVLSYDPQGNHELYIEVKTTAQVKRPGVRDLFFMSTNEYECYLKNKGKFRLYRVYNVEGQPTHVVVDLDNLAPSPNGFVFSLS